MRQLIDLVEAHEDWLMGRILHYAKEHGYVKYTSTLKEAWRLSISGLSRALKQAHELDGEVWELGAEERYLGDPATDFAVLEAKHHRERGVDLAKFLGLFKFYRQCYLDLVADSALSQQNKQSCNISLRRFFDRVEIAFCSEWSGKSSEERIRELREANLRLTNEKNKYLTIFASLAEPVFLVDSDNCLVDLNQAATVFLGQDVAPGSHYYGHAQTVANGESIQGTCVGMENLLPWLADDLDEFIKASLVQRKEESGENR